jgi:lipopolysaccharide/colanic/teichoic acid biosynthesis glycosyltransferase
MSPLPRLPRTSSTRRALRRTVDLLVVLAASPLVLVVAVGVAVAIRVDSRGPVLIRHKRLGRGGARFDLLKFRTMVPNADELKESLRDLNVLQWPDFKIPNDPRVTRIGTILRKSSLDELPQLWNLVRGDLTLIGPRPCSIDLGHYALWQTERLEVTPGLFGRWQAEARGKANFDERCRMDIGDIRHHTVSTQIRVAYRSLAAVFTGQGAS